MQQNSSQNVEILQPSPPSGLVGNAGLATSFQCTQIPAKMLKFYNPPRRQGLPPTPGRLSVLTGGKIWSHIVISENPLRRQSLPPTPGRLRVLTVGVFPAPLLISDNPLRRQGLPPTPGRLRVLTGGLEAEGWSRAARTGWESNRGGRQERSVCLSTGLAGYGQGCCPRIVELQHQKGTKKGVRNLEVWKEVLIFGYMG